MKIYNTKYLFTDGITEHEAELSESGRMVSYKLDNTRCLYHLHGEGKEWHRTKKAAIERAEELRINKLKSLDKQVKKISALVFD